MKAPPQPATPPCDPTLYDRDRALAVAGGNERIADELLALLIRDLPRQRQALDRALDDGDRVQLRELSHRLQGSARYCGAARLQDSARQLEQALVDQAPAETVERLYRRVTAEVERFMAVYGPPT